MKTIKYLIIFTLSLFVMNSCEDGPSTDDINYIAFETNPLELVVNRNESNNIDVSLYTTQIYGSERTINIYVDLDQTTIDPAVYTVPTAVTIPANTNVVTFNISITDNNLSESGEKLVLNFEMEEGLYTGDELILDIALYCPVSLSDLVGSFSVTSGSTSLENDITTVIDGENLKISNIGTTIMTGWWEEEITDGGTCIMNVDMTTGKLTIPRQYFMTTLYNGAPSTYEIKGVGSWNNCGSSPTLQITYDIYYTGDATGIGNDNLEVLFGGLFTKD